MSTRTIKAKELTLKNKIKYQDESYNIEELRFNIRGVEVLFATGERLALNNDDEVEVSN